MNLTIKTNSWHITIYQWFYNTKQFPTNLCSYFWKLLISILLCVPFFILILPNTLLSNFKWFKREHLNRKTSSIFIYILFTFLYCEIILIINFFSNSLVFNTEKPISLIGLIEGLGFAMLLIESITIILILMTLIGSYLSEKYKSKIPKEPKPNLVWEYIKAKKNKYCPQITWVNPKTNN